MSYRTIAVHVDQARHMPARLQCAARLAQTQQAHLIGVAMTGISRFAYAGPAGGHAGAVLQAGLATLSEHANSALAAFADVAGALHLSHESRLVEDEPEGGLIQQACYADLLVVSQPDPTERLPNLVADLPGYVMLNSGRPLLILPYASACTSLDRHALVAWDGSIGATRALAFAIPLLKQARQVTLTVYNPAPPQGRHEAPSGVDVASYLARHGVAVMLAVQPTVPDIGAALLSQAATLDADLLVMGGYGHTHWHEALLGGVSRTILGNMTLPVLMAH